MPPRRYVAGSDELYAIPVDEFIRGYVANDSSDCGAEHDYDGGFGDDDDLTDMTPEQTIGCHSIFKPTFDAKELAA